MSRSMDARQIYENFHSRAAGTAGLRTAQRMIDEMAGRYSEVAESVQGVVDKVRSAWQGTAAEAALRGLVPLAEDSFLVGRQLATAADLIARQIESFHTAAAEVRPVPAEPRMQDAVKMALSGEDLQPMVSRMQAYQAAQQANVDAYAKYQAASEYNTANLPSLTDSLTLDRSPVSITAPARTVSGQNGRGAVSAAPSGATLRDYTGPPAPKRAPGTVAGRGGTAEGPVPARTGSAVPNGRPDSGGNATRTQESVALATGPTSGQAVDRTTRGVVDRATGRVAGRSAAGVAGPVLDRNTGDIGPIPGRAAGHEPGRGTSRGTDREPGRARSRGTGREPGRETARGTSRGTDRTEVVREDGRTGVATEPGTVDENPSAVGSTPGRRGDEDEEHRTRFVLAEDGETRFGPDEKVAPSVIGE